MSGTRERDAARAGRMRFDRTRAPEDLPRCSSAEDAITASTSASDELDARVGASTIEGAGYGLFARRRLAAGDVVRGVTYGGDVLSLADALKLGSEDKEYVMAMHFNVHVDARRHYGYLGRYVNDAVGTARERNVRFEKDVATRKATLRAIRDVEVGEELFAEYGRGYWRARERMEEESAARNDKDIF